MTKNTDSVDSVVNEETGNHTRKIKMGKYGLQENVIGLHCSLHLNGRTLLGEIRDAEYNSTLGIIQLSVRHFNGEDWPIKPRALAVDILGQQEPSPQSSAAHKEYMGDIIRSSIPSTQIKKIL